MLFRSDLFVEGPAKAPGATTRFVMHSNIPLLKMVSVMTDILPKDVLDIPREYGPVREDKELMISRKVQGHE